VWISLSLSLSLFGAWINTHKERKYKVLNIIQAFTG